MLEKRERGDLRGYQSRRWERQKVWWRLTTDISERVRVADSEKKEEGEKERERERRGESERKEGERRE